MATVTPAPGMERSADVASRGYAYMANFFDEPSGLNAAALLLPKRASAGTAWAPEGGDNPTQREMRAELEHLGMRLLRWVSPSELPAAVLWAVGDSSAAARASSLRSSLEPSGPLPFPGAVEHDPSFPVALEFAEYLVFAPVMPAQQSPLHAGSLAALLAGAGTTGAGALVEAGADPLVAVKIGVGAGAFMIVVGVARVINEAATHHLRRWLRVPDTPPPPPPDDPGQSVIEKVKDKLT